MQLITRAESPDNKLLYSNHLKTNKKNVLYRTHLN